ncbi:MAG: DUF5034 domain-containing protein [Bacteroidetes bacterium]|nr:DUF5034 domain-containing protein [Bacteroidota bacterium]
MRIVRISGFLALLALLSCDTFNSGPPCTAIQGQYIRVLGLDISNQQMSPCCDEPIPPFSKIHFKEYRMQLNFQIQYYSELKTNSMLWNSCYAYDCPQNGENGSKETISEFDIVSLYDFDENHKKGESVRDLFDYEENKTRISLNTYMKSNSRHIRRATNYLYLMQEPTQSDTVAFKITLSLDNGNKFTEITSPVIFN